MEKLLGLKKHPKLILKSKCCSNYSFFFDIGKNLSSLEENVLGNFDL